jgi:hypothetical protein
MVAVKRQTAYLEEQAKEAMQASVTPFAAKQGRLDDE